MPASLTLGSGHDLGAGVAEFEALRPHLVAVAYRLTGTVADAEDIVQEAWLRWNANDTAIADLRSPRSTGCWN